MLTMQEQNMAATYRYQPDYAVPPGSLLKEYLAAGLLQCRVRPPLRPVGEAHQRDRGRQGTG